MGIDELFNEMPETIEFKGDTYVKDDKILGYGENVAVAYFQQGGKGAVMAFYNQGQIIYTPDGQDIQLICILDNGVSAETVLNGIKRGEMFTKGVKKSVKKLFEFNDSRYDAFKYAFESEWSMLCMRNEGVTHEETQLDDKHFVAVVRCPQEPLPDFEFEAFIGSLESMGFKLDYYTDGPYENGLIYEFYAIDNQTHGYESLLDEPVEVVDEKGNSYTLREAIEEFGIRSEPDNLDDARVFARCPRLKGLVGPMAPNHGYVARYETQAVYDFLSRSTRKSKKVRGMKSKGMKKSQLVKGSEWEQIDNGYYCGDAQVLYDEGMGRYEARVYGDAEDAVMTFDDLENAIDWCEEQMYICGKNTRKSLKKSIEPMWEQDGDDWSAEGEVNGMFYEIALYYNDPGYDVSVECDEMANDDEASTLEEAKALAISMLEELVEEADSRWEESKRKSACKSFKSVYDKQRNKHGKVIY